MIDLTELRIWAGNSDDAWYEAVLNTCADEIERLRAALATARRDALEEARRMIFVEISPQPHAEADWSDAAVEMAQYLAAQVALMKDRTP